MAEIKLKAIPSPSNLPPEIQAFAGPVKEAIDVLLGRVGNGADAAITRRSAGKIVGGTTIINAGTPSSGGYIPDLTPPPAPTGLVATPGFSVINLEWNDSPYSAGHGHSHTVIYRSSDALRGNAVQIGMTPGTIYVDAVGSSAGPFFYWIRYVTRDGVMGAWNAVDGISASTSADPAYLLDLLAGSIDESALKTETIGGKDAFVFDTKTFAIKYSGSGYVPFMVQAAPTVINGHTIPAGVYLDTAFMRRFVAQAGQIGSLAVDDAAIANLSASKLTVGDGTIGGRLKSAYFLSAVAGWQIHPDGTAEFNNVLVRGTVYAESGYFKGTLLGGAATSIGIGTGLWAGYDSSVYKFRLGVPGSSRMEWNGSAFTIYGSGGQVLMSSGSGIPWGQIESRPTSLSALDASASTKLNGIQDGATVGANTSNLNIGLGVNLLPNTEWLNNNIAPAVMGWNVSNCTLLSGASSTPDWVPTGGNALTIYQGARNGNQYNIGADIYPSGGYADAATGIPVIAGKRYELSCKVAMHRCDSIIAVDFFDTANTYLGGFSSGWIARNSGGKKLANWGQAVCFGVAPANAAYASIYFRKSDTDTNETSSYAWFTQPHFGLATDAQTVASAYTPGTSYAALTANWGNVSGSGKPQDNATYGATWGANIAGQPSNSILLNNLIDPGTWVAGDGAATGFNLNGSLYENYREPRQLPDGSRGMAWICFPGRNYNGAWGWDGTGYAGSGPAGDADGGWNTDTILIDRSKVYRFSVWVKRSGGTTGHTFFGSSGGNTTGLMEYSGSVNTNPYFWSGLLPTFDRWHLLVGYIFPEGLAWQGQGRKGGVWDAVTGKKVEDGWDYLWNAGQTSTIHRAYLFYSAPGCAQEMCWPRVELCDGTEPSIDQLLAMSAISGRNPITSSNATTFIENAAIGAAQIGSIALVGTSNFSVKTSASGARMEMDSRVIKVYDDQGRLRVRLGDLSA